MIITHAGLQGKRPTMEDNEIIELNGKGTNKNKRNVNLFAVFDGHGGSEISKYLKKNLGQYFMNPKTKYPLNKTYCVDVCNKLQNEIKTLPNEVGFLSGSTALIGVIFQKNNNKYLNIINIGDCRSVLCRNNIAVPLTVDHKPNYPIEKRRIENLGGVIKKDLYDWRIGNLSVSRAFGDLDTAPYVTPEPDLYRYKLVKSDKFLIFGCDGLWDCLTNQQVCNFILNNFYNETLDKLIYKKKDIAQKVAQYAIASGSTDNVSVIIIFF
jgi:serine/threonine protein phosphatase PrpC